MSGQLSRALAPEALAGLRSTLRALGTGRAWMPTACNAATCTAFAASMYLATVLSDTPYVMVFALAPMLLLLCYDPVMQYYVGDAQVRCGVHHVVMIPVVAPLHTAVPAPRGGD